jgi:hypothetical protein
MEAFIAEGILGDPEILFEDDRVSSGHDESYLLMPAYGRGGDLLVPFKDTPSRLIS